MRNYSLLVGLFLLSVTLPAAADAPANEVPAVDRSFTGVTLQMDPGVLRLQVISPSIIRVTYSLSNSLPSEKSLAVIRKPSWWTHWKVINTPGEVIVRTDRMEAHVNRATGAVVFFDKYATLLLAEKANGGKSLAATYIAGTGTLRSQQKFMLSADEAIFGLGQHSQGLMNYRGSNVRLEQKNPTESAVPVLVSSRGYGILWDNPAITDVDAGLSDPNVLSWTSEASDSIDYYFMYGPELDDVVADYRDLTGAAPMLGKWGFGFWQCKERYKSQQELLDVAGWYRTHHVPLDGIIQDWQYWDPHPWGSHQFDTNRYPDPAKLMQTLHAEHVHALISVWPKFDIDSTNANELRSAGALYPQVIVYSSRKTSSQWYDPFDPEARKIYWRQMSREIFSYGFDGWWLDASEPELGIKWGEYRDFKTGDGPGVKVYNGFPLMHTTAVYTGQRAENPDKRVFILTRSAYAGQQRNSAVTWSGDIRGTWPVFAHQIPAGLNFSLSGIPYWNTDTGGFFLDANSAGYPELFTRWFQFSAFCPMFRVHGTSRPKEIWRFDEPTQKILIDYDQLRYHLMPYIYSVAWKVTSEGYTMMRPLVMDFRTDKNVFNISDQYLFGPAIMVNPVTKSGANSRAVYLPVGTDWIDFWTGKKYPGGQTVNAMSTIETVPLFVRAGSIIPYGPEIEYATEKSDPIELRVYRGANGHFTLYEDEGDNYNYEKGKYATIPITWNESAHTLQIGKRSGSFPGMLKEHTFRIVWVAPGHGTGIASTDTPDSVVTYNGRALQLSAP